MHSTWRRRIPFDRPTTSCAPLALALSGVVALGGCTLEAGGSDGGDGDPEATSETPDDAEEPDGAPSDTSADDGADDADEEGDATVQVYFPNPDREPEPEVFPVAREVEAPAVLAGALGELLEGPTEIEEEDGFTSFFSEETAGLIDSVRLDDDGTAYVDFDASLPEVIPEASSSTGSATLTAALDATTTQFDTVDDAVYRLEGDVDAFYLWLQLTPPE